MDEFGNSWRTQAVDKVSHAMSLFLRHKASHSGYEVRSDGFIKITDTLAYIGETHQIDVSEDMIYTAVRTNNKKRFQILVVSGKPMYVRAVQGHSFAVMDDQIFGHPLTLGTAPCLMIHGTKASCVDGIKLCGILPGGPQKIRTHTHACPVEPDSKVATAGMRHRSEVYFYIDIHGFLESGGILYQSKSGALLTPNIIPVSLIYKMVSAVAGVKDFVNPNYPEGFPGY